MTFLFGPPSKIKTQFPKHNVLAIQLWPADAAVIVVDNSEYKQSKEKDKIVVWENFYEVHCLKNQKNI